jgi:hypothetical protein
MIPLVKQFFRDLLFSPERVTLWARGFLGWAGTVIGIVAAQGTAAMWTWKPWVAGALVGAGMLFKAGDKNLKAPMP